MRSRLREAALIALLSAFGWFQEACAESSAIDLIVLAKRARPAVVLVVVSDASGKEITTGTGFVVSGDGKLITNRHVIEKGASAIAKTENGGKFTVLGVLAEAAEDDLVLLQLEGRGLPFLPLGSSEKLESGQRVAVVGNPFGLEGTLSEGIVSAIREESPGKRRWIQITAAISPGSSGSPVLGLSGEVVGVATSGIRQGQALNFAIPVETVKKLLTLMFDVPRPLVSVAAKSGYENSPETKAFNAAQEAGDTAGMLKSGQAMVRRFPDESGSYGALGFAYYRLGFYPEAVAALKEAIKLQPENAGTWLALGFSYRDDKRLGEAVRAYEQAVKLKPDSVAGWDSLARACILLGQYGRAREAIQQLESLDPDSAKGLSAVLRRMRQ